MFDLYIDGIRSLIKNKNIEVLDSWFHTKASEAYIRVIFYYSDSKIKWVGAVPYHYRRTGVFVNSNEELAKLIEKTYISLDPMLHDKWQEDQEDYWKTFKGPVTSLFFQKLKNLEWNCVNCDLPQNPNFARRIQDIKEMGYTLITEPRTFCKKCKKQTTKIMMLPITRGGESGYETFSKELRLKIIKSLDNIDAYENHSGTSLLPDHKFPEIRWDEKTPQKNSIEMTDSEIKQKFQLLSNQRNQQKREACRDCYQTNKRGKLFGINFFYEGNADWPSEIPKRGKSAEKGCVGCGWYDIQKWREELNIKNKNSQ